MSALETQARWWNLDRNGNPLDPLTLPSANSGVATNSQRYGSPYIPTNFVNGALPPTHLHHQNNRIVGIHGHSDLIHLRLTLKLCLVHEARIIGTLADKHRIDIWLSDVLELLNQPA